MTRSGTQKGDDVRRPRLGVAAAIVLVITTVAVTVVIGVVRTASSPIDSVDASAPEPAVTTPAPPTPYVHVFGAVAHPGLYRLAPGSRVVDVIAAAGGFTSDADPAGVNLARLISDGEQLQVLRVGEEPAAPAAAGSSGGGSAVIDLNTADEAALETLPRIGPALAGRIVAWRSENGPFTSIDDLLAVPGIGEKLLAGLRELVTV